MLKHLKENYEEHEMKVNAKRTKGIIITRNRVATNVKIRRTKVEQQASYHLGSILREGMKCGKDIDKKAI